MATTTNQTEFDLVGQIMRFEGEGLPEDEVVELFQYLVDSGVINSLQGSYGRQAAALIADGAIQLPDTGR